MGLRFPIVFETKMREMGPHRFQFDLVAQECTTCTRLNAMRLGIRFQMQCVKKLGVPAAPMRAAAWPRWGIMSGHELQVEAPPQVAAALAAPPGVDPLSAVPTIGDAQIITWE